MKINVAKPTLVRVNTVLPEPKDFDEVENHRLEVQFKLLDPEQWREWIMGGKSAREILMETVTDIKGLVIEDDAPTDGGEPSAVLTLTAAKIALFKAPWVTATLFKYQTALQNGGSPAQVSEQLLGNSPA